ncbi:MAG: substrate-binding domain-containing protein [Kiritimatiellaeota bacterium]|nr:substrate-binding domain-containing protein [Kiritimatiellota bacterium]
MRTTTRGVNVAESHVFQASELQNPQFHTSLNFEQDLLGGLLDGCAHFKARAGIIPTDNLLDTHLLDEVGGETHGGVIVAGMYSDDLGKFLARCAQPVVLLDLLFKDGPDTVTSDNVDGMRQSVRHLVGLGHREIGFVGARNPSYEERYFGFVGEMTLAGLTVRPEFTVETPGGVTETARRVAPVLSRRKRPTALVACSDYYAMGAMEAARELGLRVPRDLSLVGYDDVEIARNARPALTSVHVPVREMGRQAVARLLSLPAGAAGKTGGAIVRVPVSLVVRESSAAALGKGTKKQGNKESKENN